MLGQVKVRFEGDRYVAEDDRADNPLTLDEAFLRQSLFQVPVMVEVHGIQIFAQETGLYYMATRGYEVVESLGRKRRAVLTPPLGGKLVFEVVGDEVTILDPLTGREVQCRLPDLQVAWSTFTNTARQWLLREFPELVDHRQAGAWFRAEGIDR